MDTYLIYGFLILIFAPAYPSTLYHVTEVASWKDASTFCNTHLSGAIVEYGSELLQFLESCNLQNVGVWLEKPWPEYLGCKIEKLPLRIKTNIQNNEMLECLNYCGSSSQLGVQRKACKCFSTTTKFGRHSTCSTVCPGNSGEMCGGFRSMDTYRIVDSLTNSQCQSLLYTNQQEYRLQPDSCSSLKAFVCKDNLNGQENICNYKKTITLIASASFETTMEQTKNQPPISTESAGPSSLNDSTTNADGTTAMDTPTTEADDTETKTVPETTKVLETTTLETLTSILKSTNYTTETTSITTMVITEVTTNEINTTKNQPNPRPPVSIQMPYLDELMYSILGIVAIVTILVIVFFCVTRRRRRETNSNPDDKGDFEIVTLSEIERYASDIRNHDEDEYNERKESRSFRRRLSTGWKKISRKNFSSTRHNPNEHHEIPETRPKEISSDKEQIQIRVQKRSIKGRQYMSTGEFASVYFRHRPIESQPLENIRYMSTQFVAGHSIKSLYDKAGDSEFDDRFRTLGRTSTFKPDAKNTTIQQPERSTKPIVTIRQ